MDKIKQLKIERQQNERKLFLSEMKNKKEGEKYLFLFENDIEIHNDWYKEGVYLYGEEIVYEYLKELNKQKQYNFRKVVIERREQNFLYDKIIVSNYLIEGDWVLYTTENCFGEEFANLEISKEITENHVKDYEEVFEVNFYYNEEIQKQVTELLNNNQILKINLEIK